MGYKKINSFSFESVKSIFLGSSSKPEYHLEGNTMRVYWYFLTKGSRGIRETQKDLHFSSPSTASYQLKKLVDLDLLTKIDGTDKYRINKKINTGIFGFFILIGHYMVPKFFLYFIIHLIVLMVLLLVLFVYDLIRYPVLEFCLLDLLFNAFILIKQTIKIWKLRPL